MTVDVDLLRTYNRSLPRYTSYPTAPHFAEDAGREVFWTEVQRSNAAAA
jgi:oxygen-independent coproporphyrinogen-3 oxidase